MLTVMAEHPIYVVMDALDECPDHSGIPTAREEVLVVLKDLVGLYLLNLRICVTSRPEVDIKSILNQLTIHSISLHGESEQRKGIADFFFFFLDQFIFRGDRPKVQTGRDTK